MAKKEKIIFSKKCKCRCKNSMTQEDIMFKMRLCGQKDKYAFWCRGCLENVYVSKKELPRSVVKELDKRFRRY